MGILVNGNGNPHVYAHQDSDLIAGIVGNQTSIMPVGDKFEANQEDANTIALSSGVIITKEGRRIQLDAGTIDEFIIPTGAQDVQSFYIIGYHLYEDGNSDQLCETFVRKMESASDTIPESTFRSGATEVYVSLYRVTQDSLNITDIDLLLPYADSIAEVKRNGGNKNLAAIEDGSTASQPYVKGEFVIVGGQFCEVTASISTNDAFIAYPLPNYNIKAGTVGEQITALNQNLMQRPIYNPQDDYLYGYDENGVLKRSVIRLGINRDYIFLNGVWNTDAKEDGAITIYYGGTSAYNNGGGVKVADGLIKLDSKNLSSGYARNTQVRINNDGRKIIIKYKTSDSPTAQIQTMEINNGYTSTYLLLVDTAWNGISVNTKIAVANTRYSSYTIAYNAGESAKYITEIYVEPAS